MRTHLIVVADTSNGTRYSFSPNTGTGNAIAVDAPSEIKWIGEMDKLDLRRVSAWACNAADVPIIVEELSKEWVGHEIKVFNLVEIHSRIPGELKHKRVEEDGVLP